MERLKSHPVSLVEVIRARAVIGRFLKPTPLIRYEGLSQVIEADVYAKHENHNPSGSFKIRGGINLLHHVKSQGAAGVVTFSTGNHGLSIATTSAWLGLPAVVVVPEASNPAKTRAIRETGAELIEAGRTFEEAGAVVEEWCARRGYYYAHPANEPHLINGVATGFLEVIEELPDVDVVIVPIGAGSEAAAAITTLHGIRPEIEILAVQATSSPAAFLSWEAKKILSAPNKTFAGVCATGQAYELPFSIYRDGLAGFVTRPDRKLSMNRPHLTDHGFCPAPKHLRRKAYLAVRALHRRKRLALGPRERSGDRLVELAWRHAASRSIDTMPAGTGGGSVSISVRAACWSISLPTAAATSA